MATRTLAGAAGAIVVGVLLTTTSHGAAAVTAPAADDDGGAAVIATYRARIPELMAEQGIPGLAVALVDVDKALWVQGFGHLDGSDSSPVTADTIFSVQSMSKLITATAVMQAVAGGRLDLDVPITTYLPDFTVHSAFEKHPERKVTLRMLLSHTAGFTQEAPVGNNYQLAPADFDAHVRSISGTWLRFPVGTGYAYSNLGIDLAGYILERVEGKPFAEAMHDSLLGPLGMNRSTFDRTVIRSANGRAVGHVDPYPDPPLYEPMTAAGGMYSSAADLARFLRFQLSNGSLDGRMLLDPKSMEEMRTVPAPHAGEPAGYALGVVRHRWNRWQQRPDLLEHGGGGYGFRSDLWWAPQLGIGVAILTNSDDHQLQNNLALSILSDLVTQPGVYRDRLLALPSRPPVADPDLLFQPPAGMANLVAKAAMVVTGDVAARWSAYVGTYRRPVWGYLDPAAPPDRFVLDAGVPYFEAKDPETESLVRHHLTEVRRGLFVADNGETLDLRGRDPTWRNLRLTRVTGGPAPWQWALLAIVAVVAAGWLASGSAASLGRRRTAGRSLAGRASPGGRTGRRLTAAVAALGALAALATVASIRVVPGLVDVGFLGWMAFPLPLRLALHLPLIAALLAAGLAAFLVAGALGHWWTRRIRTRDAALVLALTALTAQLASWHLVGWGL